MLSKWGIRDGHKHDLLVNITRMHFVMQELCNAGILAPPKAT
jgi:hypothetical protein